MEIIGIQIGHLAQCHRPLRIQFYGLKMYLSYQNPLAKQLGQFQIHVTMYSHVYIM